MDAILLSYGDDVIRIIKTLRAVKKTSNAPSRSPYSGVLQEDESREGGEETEAGRKDRLPVQNHLNVRIHRAELPWNMVSAVPRSPAQESGDRFSFMGSLARGRKYLLVVGRRLASVPPVLSRTVVITAVARLYGG